MTKRKIAFLSISIVMMAFLLGGALFGQSSGSSQKSDVYRYLSIFGEVFKLVRGNYVEEVPADQLMDGAFSGVTDAIDEFSFYVPPGQMAAFQKFTPTEDNGIGLVVTKRFGYAFVIAPVAGSPAAKAGIERGDFIEKIDGQPTQKMSVWQVRNALQAKDSVHLQVLRGGQTKRDDFTIQKTSFHPVALTTQQYGQIAYIKVPFFEKGTAAQFANALETARKSGSHKLIVDVRGNAAGDVDEAITAADALLTSGLITSVEGRKVEAHRWQADRATAYDGEVEVLTDSSTAGGAELFASAIHGNSRGKTVGVTTYGKSIVQKFITLPSGGGVFMTIGHYTTPDGKAIKEQGLKPDVAVDLSAQIIRDPNNKEKDEKPREDLILQKALALFGQDANAAEKKKAA
jgi:carboxyl-terminal processing protease